MNIKPFKAYRYDSDVTGNPGECIAPPYDVIDSDQQEKLYQQSPFNIVRLNKGKVNADDSQSDNVYTRANTHLRDFIEKGALKQDKSESVYVYSQDFTIAGTAYRRTGFIALGELEEYGGGIKPHEQTLAGPKADRLNLMRATSTQIGQIFMLYSDAEQTIDTIMAEAAKGPELLSLTDEDNVLHQLFAITNPGQLETIQKVMADKSVFIADGHHRYETALNYYNETKDPNARYRMMTFINTHNEGLVILPTHRLIKNVGDFDPETLIEKMKAYFDVAIMPYEDMLDKKEKNQTMQMALNLEYENGEHAFGMYFNNGAFYIATLRDVAVMAEISPDMSDAWRALDVSILHKLILEKMLGIDEAALTAQTNVEYIKDFGPATLHAMDKVDTGECQGLFFLNTTRPADVENVAKEGEKMPQKSTFFFPKIFSGLTLNVLK
ncbi:MAG: DUF1015 domain-containing protein [Phycisphaerae bacterium]|nr:DUF1015 domain-containing protein [Phycisphaerae bacterium]